MTGIVKEFPGVRALSGVDLDVRAGEVHCLLGQNGAGKSTLIKVLAAVHQPDEGTIVWDGEPITLAHSPSGPQGRDRDDLPGARPGPTPRCHREPRSATRSCGCRGGAPASSWASTSPRSRRKNPEAIGCILGGHGITAWGDTSDEAEANSLWIIETAQAYIDANGKKEPFGKERAKFAALPDDERRAKAAALAATIRGLASHDKPMVGHFTDDPRVLEFLASAKAPKLAELGTSCPDHFLRTKVKPMLLDLPSDAPVEKAIARLKELHEAYRADYTAYYEKHATADSPRDPRRRPAHRARARVSACSATARTSRPPGSPASSTSTRST